MKPEEAYTFTCDKIGICGCCDHSPIDLIQTVLEWAATPHDKRPTWDGFIETVFSGNDPAAYCTLTLCDRAGLLEHGSSIRGAWLTKLGKDYLACLKDYTPELIWEYADNFGWIKND